jgi:hypothetical protein
MTLYTLDDGSGKVLDTSKAQEFPDASRSDRHGTSKATLDPYDRETLYRTESGHWILMRWQKADAPRSPKATVTVPITSVDAMQWLLKNDYEEVAKKHFAKDIAELTI